jgi:hypothetical protein
MEDDKGKQVDIIKNHDRNKFMTTYILSGLTTIMRRDS